MCPVTNYLNEIGWNVRGFDQCDSNQIKGAIVVWFLPSCCTLTLTIFVEDVLKPKFIQLMKMKS